MTTQLPGYSEHTGDKSWSFALTDDVMRFEVRAGDRWSGDVVGKERSEISLNKGMATGVLQTIEYDFKIESGAANSSKWMIIGQLHALEDSGDISAGAPIEIGLQGEKLRVNVRADANAQTKVAPDATAVFTDTDDIVRDRWYHLKIDFVLDPFGDGLLRVYKDGVKMAEYHGAIGYNDDGAPYWKMGVYRGNASETMAMDVKNLNVSLDVDPASGQQVNGSEGRDHLYGYGGDDYMRGYGGDDVLIGGDGNDNINGGAGADKMIGGAGNDIYFVDSIKDQVIEASGGGTDTVNSSINYKLDPYVEYLILLGSSNLTGEGNGLNNKITGNSGANTLSGLDGDDILDGGAGADTLIGGKGDDTFVIDNAGDQIVEMSGGGIDTVKTALSNYALGDHVENLIMTGMGGQAKGNTLGNHMIGDKGDNIIDGKGGDDVIEGGWGNDIIIGGGGNDILTGNQNADVFRFGMGSGKDVITDFGQGYYDSLDFSGWISNGYRPVMSVDGNDVVFSNGAGDSVRLLGVHATSLATTATGYTDK